MDENRKAGRAWVDPATMRMHIPGCSSVQLKGCVADLPSRETLVQDAHGTFHVVSTDVPASDLDAKIELSTFGLDQDLFIAPDFFTTAGDDELQELAANPNETLAALARAEQWLRQC